MNKGINSKSGFTLAELLAAMMVFSIIMLACANLVSQASNSFKIGLNQVEAQDTGRVINQEFFRTLQGAVYADTYPFMVETNPKPECRLEGGNSEAMAFITTSPTKLHWTTHQEVMIWVEKASTGAPKGTMYLSNRWPGGSQGYRNRTGIWRGHLQPDSNNTSILAENIYSFNVRVFDHTGNEVTGKFVSHDEGRAHPSRVDVTITVLDEETWAKHATAQFANLVQRNKRTIKFSQTYSNRGAWNES